MTVLNSTLSVDQMAQRIAELEAQVAAGRNSKLSFKVSDKGAISVYGMGRFPVTLYRGQMERLLGQAVAIKAFIAANSASLKTKD